MSYKELTAQQLFEKGIAVREKYLETARDNSKVTLPYLYPDTDTQPGEIFESPYQSLGAKAVSHLSSQLLNVLFPTNQPFFRLTSDLNEADDDPELMFEVDEALSRVEKVILKEIDKRALRSNLYNALRLLVVGGTVVLSFLDDSFRVLKLNQFVVKRNPDRSLKYVIYKDIITAEEAAEYISIPTEQRKRENYDLYTIQYYEEDGKVTVCQEIEGEKVVEEEFDRPPIFVVTTNILDDEDYGRSIAEESQGDLYTFERLSEAVAQSAAMASKFIFLVDPAGALRGRDLAEASTGDVISGRATDVTVVQSQKQADLGIIFNHIQDLKERIGKAFLMATETFPGGNMTATEARARINEIEASLGGAYSQLSQTLQMPFIQLMIQHLEEKNLIPKIPEGVSTNIVTGLDLLDRKSKVVQIQEFLSVVAGLGPQALDLINPVAIVRELAQGIGLEVDKFVNDPNQEQDISEAMTRTQQNLMTRMADSTVQGAGAATAGVAGQAMTEQMMQAFRGQQPM